MFLLISLKLPAVYTHNEDTEIYVPEVFHFVISFISC